MSFEPPTNNLSQSDLEASNKQPVYVTVAVSFVLATGSVILRGVARHRSKASFGWDDYTIVLALVSFLLSPSIFSWSRLELAKVRKYHRFCSMVWTSIIFCVRRSMDWVDICPLFFPLSFLFKKSVYIFNTLPHFILTETRRPSPTLPSG